MKKNLFHGALLEAVLLSLINEASNQGLHGYALLKMMHKKFGVQLGPSTLYPELQLLEKQALIASSWEFSLGRMHRQYRITRRGQNVLREYFAELKIVVYPLVI